MFVSWNVRMFVCSYVRMLECLYVRKLECSYVRKLECLYVCFSLRLSVFAVNNLPLSRGEAKVKYNCF